MKTVAWVGSLREFITQFEIRQGSHNAKIGKFIDTTNDTEYICVNTHSKFIGARFDEVVMGYSQRPSEYFDSIYQECLMRVR